MKKLFLPSLAAIATLFAVAAHSQPIDIDSPGAQGLFRQIPYMSTWSEKWLTNNSASGAVWFLFSDTNSATAMWNEIQPYLLVENTNALTASQQNALNYAAGLTNTLVQLEPLPDVLRGLNGVNWLYPQGIGGGILETNIGGVLFEAPLAIQMPDVIFNPSQKYVGHYTNFWTVQSGDVGNVIQDYFAPFSNTVTYVYPNYYTNSATNYTAQFEPNSFFDGISLWSSPGYVTNNVAFPSTATILWYVDKYGNMLTTGSQFTGGTNTAAAFVGGGGLLTGITPAQVQAVATNDPSYLTIPKLATTNALNAVATNTSFPLNSAAYAVYAVTATNPMPLWTNTYGRRVDLYVNYVRTNASWFMMSNLVSTFCLMQTNSVVSGGVTGITNIAYMNIPTSPGDVVQVTASASVGVLRVFALGF